ncbi:MAG: hypothetical protein QOH10_1127 [Actinomycetota bacterium]|jgi:hypothetical protein|nr:hypothetical protein [Actinomycetota bacterium]
MRTPRVSVFLAALSIPLLAAGAFAVAGAVSTNPKPQVVIPAKTSSSIPTTAAHGSGHDRADDRADDRSKSADDPAGHDATSTTTPDDHGRDSGTSTTTPDDHGGDSATSTTTPDDHGGGDTSSDHSGSGK